MQIHIEASSDSEYKHTVSEFHMDIFSSTDILLLSSVALPMQNGESGTKHWVRANIRVSGWKGGDQSWLRFKHWDDMIQLENVVYSWSSFCELSCWLFRSDWYFWFVKNFFGYKLHFGIWTIGWYWILCFSSISLVGHNVWFGLSQHMQSKPKSTASRTYFSGV